jgi:hypothetical protein
MSVPPIYRYRTVITINEVGISIDIVSTWPRVAPYQATLRINRKPPIDSQVLLRLLDLANKVVAEFDAWWEAGLDVLEGGILSEAH